MWIIIAIVNGFNTQPHEGGCRTTYSPSDKRAGFNTQPHEGGCPARTTAPSVKDPVSTHSRTKAAANTGTIVYESKFGFNTQPHEGGCLISVRHCPQPTGFNTQPHEGGCNLTIERLKKMIEFQHTAARRRLHLGDKYRLMVGDVSTHSRTKAAAKLITMKSTTYEVSTHSRTKAAAVAQLSTSQGYSRFNTQPHEGGCV